MQHKAVYLLFCEFTLHVSGVNPHPSSGVHKTVTIASGTGYISCAATSLQRGQATHHEKYLNCNYNLRYWSYFLCSYLPPTWPSYPSWGVHKTVTTASGTGHIQQVHSTCFGCQPRPSSGINKTVTTASGTVQLPPSNVANLATLEGGSCTVPEALVTVLCTPDNGCGWHPKRVEWTCRIINRVLFVASRWKIINIILLTFLQNALSPSCG